MTETPKWPSYSTGPKESLLALGVASVKYAELESVIAFMFGTVFGLGVDATTLIVSKIGFEAATQLMSRRLVQLAWSDKFKDAVGHFIAAINICNANRNSLAHSNIMWTDHYGEAIPFMPTDKTVLFKSTKNGHTIGAAPTLPELRGIADDINTYCEYGRMLGNALNVALSNPPTFSPSPFPWPSKPALPRNLEYKSGPIPL
jgi:hypothetical protein